MDKLNDALLELGFDYQGDFDPMELDADDFNTCEIGAFIVATQKESTVVLDYSDTTYWDIDNDSIETILKAIEAVAKYELGKINHD